MLWAKNGLGIVDLEMGFNLRIWFVHPYRKFSGGLGKRPMKLGMGF